MKNETFEVIFFGGSLDGLTAQELFVTLERQGFDISDDEESHVLEMFRKHGFMRNTCHDDYFWGPTTDFPVNLKFPFTHEWKPSA